MKTLGVQFLDIIEPRLVTLNQKAAPVIAEDIKDRMLQNTSEGRAFGNDEYVNEYSARYAKRRAQPPQFPKRSPVILRNKDNAIDTAGVTANRSGAEIAFKQKGNIFKFHHTGTARGGKTRSIFPKSLASVPAETNRLAVEAIGEVLRG